MKKLILMAIIGVFILFSNQSPAQDTVLDPRNVWTGGQSKHLVFGDLSPLKDQTTFNVIVTPHIQKMGASEEPDSVYVAKRVSEWNAEKPGRGDQWLSYWNNARSNFKTVFIAGLNNKLVKYGVSVGDDDSWAEYTFILYTKHLMEFMGSMYIILDIDVVMTSSPEVKIASIRCPVNNSALGGQYCSSNYEQAYYSAGYLLGRYLAKNVYK